MTTATLNKKLVLLVLMIALVILGQGTVRPEPGHAACSPYIGRAVINEVRAGPLTFIEVKILDPSLDSSEFNTWSLTVCNSREGCSGPHSLSTFTDSAPYHTTDVVPEKYVDLSPTGARSGTDFLLTDANGDAVDYLTVAGYTMQQVVCGYQFDTVFPGGNSFEAARIPDGTGAWTDLDSGGNSIPPTEGDTNDDPTGTLPRLQTAGVTVPEGGTADFVVTLVDAGGNPTTAATDITVEFTTIDDTATAAGGDYTAVSGILTIPAGAGSGTVPVETLMDTLDDDGEQFYLFLSNPANASIINHYALATISGTLPALDHFRIQAPAAGLTCQPAEIIITACQNSDCSLTYDDPVDLDLSPSGWVGGDTQTLGGGTGAFSLRHTAPGTVTLDITGSDPATAGPVECYVDGTPGSCDLEFFETGFVFDVPNLTSCQTSGNVAISAVRLDDATQTCIADGGFADRTANVNFWSTYQNPLAGATAVTVNGTSVAGASPGTPVGLTFDADARAVLTVRYDDAGQLLLNARFVGSGDEAGLVMNANDGFVVSPFSLAVVATTDGTTPLDNTADIGDPHFPAGADFQIDVTAVCQDGTTVTPNFAWPTTVSAVAPYQPGGGTLGTLNNGSFAAADFASGAAGTTTAQYTEVGTTTLQATAANYLGAGDVTGTSGVVGRFTPDHFSVAYNIPRFGTSCSTGGFTYTGQYFEYETRPVLTVTAENRLNGTTLNYTDVYGGDWFKITNGSLTGITYSEATGSLDTSRIPSPDPAILDIGNGTADLTFSAGTVAANEGIALVRADPTNPFDAEISLRINVLDEDGIAYPGNPAQFGDATPGNGILFDNGKTMRWGRLLFQNAFGPEILPLAVPLLAEYYVDDDTGFVQNTADSCTSLLPADLTLTSAVAGPQPGNLPIAVRAGYDTTATFATPSFTGGDAGLSLSAPGEGGDGWVDLTVDLNPSGLDRPWLQYDWDNDANHDDNPAARATFGIFKGNSNVIYRRQTFR